MTEIENQLKELRTELSHVHQCLEIIKTALMGDMATKTPGLLFEHEEMKVIVKRIDQLWWKLCGMATAVSLLSPIIYKWIGVIVLAKPSP